MRLLFLIFIASTLLTGCPSEPTQASGPVETCTKVGEQCKMGRGQIGVCMNDMKSDPPTLFCMSQH